MATSETIAEAQLRWAKSNPHTMNTQAALERQIDVGQLKYKKAEGLEALYESVRNSTNEVREMKDNLQSLIDSCDDNSCAEDFLCTKCRLISSWIKPEEDSNGHR